LIEGSRLWLGYAPAANIHTAVPATLAQLTRIPYSDSGHKRVPGPTDGPGTPAAAKFGVGAKVHLDQQAGGGGSVHGAERNHPAPADQHRIDSSRRTTFHVILAVWGRRYCEQMVDICFPALLAPGNLPALRAFGDVKIVIVTPEEDERALRGDGLVRKLGSLAEIVFIDFQPQHYSNSHAALSAAHRLAIDLAMAEEACGIVLTPDLICSENTLLSAGRAAAAGAKAVLVPGLRLQAETAIPSLMELGLRASDGNHPVLAPRNLVAFALRHLHPESKRSFTDSDEFNPYPTFFIWPLRGKGLLQRCFHLHPLLIDFRAIDRRALETLEYSSIDGAFVGSAFRNRDEIHVEQDSDNIVVFSFSPAQERTHPPAKNRFSTSALSKAAYRYNVDALHRHLFTKPIRLHTGDLDAEWRTLEAETSRTASHARTLAGELGALLPLSQAARHALAMMPTLLSFRLRETAFRSTHRASFILRDTALRTKARIASHGPSYARRASFVLRETMFRLTHRAGFLVRTWTTRLTFLARETHFRLDHRLKYWVICGRSRLLPAIRERRYRVAQRVSFFIRETPFRIASRASFFLREWCYRLKASPRTPNSHL
jgi:hypothetical protein